MWAWQHPALAAGRLSESASLPNWLCHTTQLDEEPCEMAGKCTCQDGLKAYSGKAACCAAVKKDHLLASEARGLRASICNYGRCSICNAQAGSFWSSAIAVGILRRSAISCDLCGLLAAFGLLPILFCCLGCYVRFCISPWLTVAGCCAHMVLHPCSEA